MKLLQKLLDFYINSSIHVALSVYALLRITELYFNLPYNEHLDYFIFFGTIFGYNFTKYAEFSVTNFLNFSKSLKLTFLVSVISLIATIYYGFQLKISTILWFIPFGLLTLCYSFPFGFDKTLRNIPSLKIVVIGVVWAGTTAFLPVFDSQNEVSILMIIQRFLIVIILTLPFDIRDFKSDDKRLQTIPQLIGVERTKKLGFILLLFTMLIEFFITPNQQTKFVFILVFFSLILFLQRASTKQSKYYSAFWVEGIPILWWILLLIPDLPCFFSL